MCSDAQPWSNIWKHIPALTEHERWILNKHLKLHVPPPKTITSFSVTCCDLRKTLQASPSVSLLIINRKRTHDISQLIQKTESCKPGQCICLRSSSFAEGKGHLWSPESRAVGWQPALQGQAKPLIWQRKAEVSCLKSAPALGIHWLVRVTIINTLD